MTVETSTMKCKDCGTDMEEIFEENMAVLCRGYFVTKEGKRVFLYMCPKCGKVEGALATKVEGALATKVEGALATKVEGALATKVEGEFNE